jgi:hypothetical protein
MAIFWLVILIGAAQAPLHVGKFPQPGVLPKMRQTRWFAVRERDRLQERHHMWRMCASRRTLEKPATLSHQSEWVRPSRDEPFKILATAAALRSALHAEIRYRVTSSPFDAKHKGWRDV